MAKRKEDTPPPGSPAWMATFGDLMNLLLCFYVLLFSMSSVNEEKLKEVAASMSQSFNIFSAGSTAIGDGILISNGVSQLNELDEYINSTGKTADSEQESDSFNEYQQSLEEMVEKLTQEQLAQSEELTEKIEEAIDESNMQDKISVTFTSQFIQLTLKGAILFDSGKVDLKEDALPIIDKVGVILEKYAKSTIEIEGHTDNVPIHNANYRSNNELSYARALSVSSYIVEHTNLDPVSLKCAGRGETLPIAENATEEGRAKNRRVEIRIYHSPIAY